jgi:RND superfamily putative drug exporter
VSTYLYRLGRSAFRRRKLVLALWLGLLVLAGVAAGTLAKPTTDSFDIPGTESMDAIRLLEERFPEAAAGGATARVVFAAPEGETLAEPDNQAAVAASVRALSSIPGVVRVADPFQTGTLAADGRIGLAQVEFGIAMPQANDPLSEAVAPARDAGLTVEMAGEALTEEFEQGASELIGLGVAAVVLVITFGSLIAAGLPLLNAVIGIGVTLAAITAATSFVDLSSFTPTLAMMLGLAVAIDYSLFIVSRYRHELLVQHAAGGSEGPPGGGSGAEAAGFPAGAGAAMGRALGTAGAAVVFAGLTVVIALVGLSVVGIPMLTEMGLAAAFAVAMAVLIALTLLPAMCGFAGRRITGGRRGQRARDPEGEDAAGRPSLGTRWARLVTRRPAPVLAVAAVGMAVLAVPALDLRLGLPDEGALPEDTTQRRAYDLIAEGFGPGFNGPLLVVVDAVDSTDPQAAGQRVAQLVGQLDGVVSVAPPAFNATGDTALVTAVPSTGPSDARTGDLVGAIRADAPELAGQTGAAVAVTGSTAVVIDFNDRMAGALVPYLGLVVGLSFLLLMVLFRSLLVPLKAALGFLLTMGATFGTVVAVFQWGWLADLFGLEFTGMVISLLPIFLIGVVFGLAMDYQVFLVTRMREEHVHGAAPVPAVVTGFQHGSRVVTACAIIMISVFSGFTLSGDDFILQMAFALAAAIALDAFVVRMTIVPAVLALLGRRAWWLPRWLDRVLPNVDVEGDRLRQALAQREPVGAGARD